MSEARTVLRTEGLSKVFPVGYCGRRGIALDRLDLEVHRGEVFRFLGPNGAGKTTTLKILMGLVTASSGKAWIMDREIGDVSIKRQIGFLPEAPYFYDYLTAEEFRRFYGQLFGLTGSVLRERIRELLGMVGLSDVNRLELRQLSKGMWQRIGS